MTVAIALSRRQLLEAQNIASGAFAPLQGFMTEAEYRSVVDHMRLPSGAPYPLPVVLDIDEATADRLAPGDLLALTFDGKPEPVGHVTVASLFRPDRAQDAGPMFGTDDRAHPGVRFFLEMAPVFVGGAITLTAAAQGRLGPAELTPAEARSRFRELGWTTVTGFQTRNVPHRAHEYLQRVALEHTDGIFIQPLVGKKKTGDFTAEAVLRGYETLIGEFYPPGRAVLATLTTSMRYAGPREAVFHAIIRRNFGCTHFVVGRDHAGVGAYYGKYEAHAMLAQFEDELGIDIFHLHGPFYCKACGTIATEKTCRHVATRDQDIVEISGTDMRRILVDGKTPDPNLMRPEVVSSLSGLTLFIEDEE